jgi:hypothetical protein
MVRQRPGGGRCFVWHSARQVPHPARPLRLRQDHDVDVHRRPARHRQRPHQRRRARLHIQGRGHLPAAGEARHRHGVPELCDLAAHDGAPERGLSAGNPQNRPRRDRRTGERGAAPRRPRRHGRQACHPALRRPAAAHGACPRHRRAAAAAPVRRTFVQPRFEAARADAHRAQAHPARGRHHLDLCHPRSGRSAGDERRDHRHEQGAHRAEGRSARHLCPAGERLCQQLHRRRQPAQGPRARGRGAGPRHRRDRRERSTLHPALPAGRGHRHGRRGGSVGAAGERAGRARPRRRWRLEGEVSQAIFLGNHVDCRVRWGAFEWKVIAHPRDRLRPGEKVYLRLDPEHTMAVKP